MLDEINLKPDSSDIFVKRKFSLIVITGKASMQHDQNHILEDILETINASESPEQALKLTQETADIKKPAFKQNYFKGGPVSDYVAPGHAHYMFETIDFDQIDLWR